MLSNELVPLNAASSILQTCRDSRSEQFVEVAVGWCHTETFIQVLATACRNGRQSWPSHLTHDSWTRGAMSSANVVTVCASCWVDAKAAKFAMRYPRMRAGLPTSSAGTRGREPA